MRFHAYLLFRKLSFHVNLTNFVDVPHLTINMAHSCNHF